MYISFLGQERFRSIVKSYYRGTAGAFLCYSVTSRASFNSLSSWLTDIRALSGNDVTIVLVGTKTDLDREREVSLLEASNFALDNGLKHFETSAYNGKDENFVEFSF